MLKLKESDVMNVDTVSRGCIDQMVPLQAITGFVAIRFMTGLGIRRPTYVKVRLGR